MQVCRLVGAHVFWFVGAYACDGCSMQVCEMLYGTVR
jgi:hypothetical protein